MKALFKSLTIIFLVWFSLIDCPLSGQQKQTYKSNGTIYLDGETYSTTGNPKVERSSSAKKKFLKSKGYNKIPNGYEIDHIIPLSEGGADVPSNMQLISKEDHKQKTARERANNSTSSTYRRPTYRSNSTFRNSNSYSGPSYSSGSSKPLHTGSRGGTYYINKNGNKTYVKKK
jgi:hypothetical protein